MYAPFYVQLIYRISISNTLSVLRSITMDKFMNIRPSDDRYISLCMCTCVLYSCICIDDTCAADPMIYSDQVCKLPQIHKITQLNME